MVDITHKERQWKDGEDMYEQEKNGESLNEQQKDGDEESEGTAFTTESIWHSR